MKCPNCITREMVVIEMVVRGEPVALHSCSSCDLRWWEGSDGLLSLSGVLDLAAVGR
jgi:transcription elongation factor Elf1